jgi:hypothetical protein
MSILTGRPARTRSNGMDEAPCNFVVLMVGLTPDEDALIRRLRKMRAQRHQLAIVQFTDKGLQCREVGRLEG